MNPINKPLIPILACLLAASLWGIFWYPLRILNDAGINGVWTSFVVYGIAATIMLPYFLRQQKDISWRLVFMIALAAGWTNLSFILASLEGKIVRVLLLFYLSPIWAIVIARFILKETISLSILLLSIIAIFGAVIMLWDAEGWRSFSLDKSDYFALSSGFAFAINNALMRKAEGINITAKMFYAFSGGCLIALIAITILAMPVPEFSNSSIVLLILIACPFILIMTGTAQYGATHLPLSLSSIIFLIEVVVGAISAAVLAGEAVSLQEYIGGAILIVAATCIAIKQT